VSQNINNLLIEILPTCVPFQVCDSVAGGAIIVTLNQAVNVENIDFFGSTLSDTPDSPDECAVEGKEKEVKGFMSWPCSWVRELNFDFNHLAQAMSDLG
jgi:hypothetical protein